MESVDTTQELKIIFDKLGLKISQKELFDLAVGVRYLDDMKTEVRKLRANTIEPAHMISFGKVSDDF